MLLRIRENAHVIAIVIGLVVLKQVMTFWLPCWAIGAPYDDRLMVTMSESLLAGNWIGPYGDTTLVKGIGFPLYLLIGRVLGVSYLHLTEFCYSLSCIVFVWATRELLPRRWMRMALFCVLLFAPVMASQECVQRIYRCSITPMFVLLIFGSLIRITHIAMKGERSVIMLPWAVTAGLSIAVLWHSREDGFWLLPAAAAFALVTIFYCVRCRAQAWPVGIAAACVPLAILMATIVGISSTNNAWYGQNMTTEMAGGNFPRAIKAIYSVDREEGEEDLGPAVAVTAEMLQRCINESPTLKSIEDDIWFVWKKWHGPVQPWNELGNNVFFWMVRDAALHAGYYETPQKGEAFYGQVADELQAAIAEGRLKGRPTMPSALMPPFKPGSMPGYLKAVWDNLAFVASSAGTESGYERSDETNVDAMDSAAYTRSEIIPEGAEPRLRMRVSVEACNVVQKVYLVLSPILGILGLAGYVCLIRDQLFRRLPGDRILLLAMTGILIGFGTLLAGLAYNHLFSTATTNCNYASGTYPLYLSFGVLGACYCATLFAGRANRKVTEDTE